MSSVRSLTDRIDAIIKNQDILIKRISDVWDKESKKTVKNMKRDVGQYKIQKFKSIFNDAVTDFYNAYTPSLYQRRGDTSSKTGGLYDVLRIRTDSEGTVVADNYIDLFDPDLMHKDRKGNDLFNKVFMEGWHGGAEDIHSHADIWGEHPSPKTPYYRTGGFVKWFSGSNRYVWRRYGKWGHKAVRTKAPYVIFTSELDRAQSNEMKQEIGEIVQRDFEDLTKTMTQKIQQIEQDIFR